ncbi:MAG TPA: PAS domain-containing sensor histidine kinase [Longimicrobiales bacterium]
MKIGTVWRHLTGDALDGGRRRRRRAVARLGAEARRSRAELARLREQAAESAELLCRVFEIAPDGIMVVDLDGRIASVNTAAARILGVSRPRLIGRTIADPAWRITALDGVPLDAEAYPDRQVLRTGRAVYGIELAVVRPDGSHRILSVNAAPLRGCDGDIVGVVGSIRDITGSMRVLEAAKRAEAAERFLSEASALLAASLDHEQTLHAIARLAIPYLADCCVVDLLEDDEEICCVAAVHADPHETELVEAFHWRATRPDQSIIGDAVLRAGMAVLLPELPGDLLARIPPKSEPLRRLREAGACAAIGVPLEVRGRVLGAILFIATDPGRRPYDERDLAVAQDLARRAAFAVENARLYRAAQRASEAKSAFLAMMSHEFRTPLTAVIGFAELLDAEVVGPLNAEQKKKLGHVRASAWRLSAMIEEILAVARVDAPDDGVRPAPIDVRAAVQEVVALVEPMSTEKGVVLHASTPDTPVEIETDALKLRQILWHLFSNAVRLTAGDVEVIARRGEGAAGAVVEARGPAIEIAPDDVPLIFEPAWETAASGSGTADRGFGLGAARRLTRILGGELEVECVPGSGGALRVVLPPRYTPAQTEIVVPALAP